VAWGAVEDEGAAVSDDGGGGHHGETVYYGVILHYKEDCTLDVVGKTLCTGFNHTRGLYIAFGL
jgi:hypothetical protein